MSIKEKDIEQFLSKCGWGNATRVALSGDASFRSYERLDMAGKKAVLMLAPPQKENTIPFIAVAEHLVTNGYSAPEIIAHNIEIGLLLLEDFGDQLLNRVLKSQPEKTLQHYTQAIDLLVDIQKLSPPKTLAHSHILPTYDKALLLKEVMLFAHWYLQEGLGTNSPDIAQSWASVWEPVFNGLSKPSVLTLRDYHAENIIILEDREHVNKIGLLDFQDAVIGHAAYDLVSLLEDARRDVTPAVEDKMMQYFIKAKQKQGGKIDIPTFIEEYNILGAQRNAKIIGIFTRLWKRDGKAQYLELIPHVWRMLERNLAHPSLSPIQQWLDATVPSEQRYKPLKEG